MGECRRKRRLFSGAYVYSYEDVLREVHISLPRRGE